VLRRLLGYGWPHRRLLGLAFGCMVALGVTTGAYAYLMGPALRFLLSGGHEGLGPVGRLFPAIPDVDRARALWLFPAFIVAIAVVKGLAYLGQFYWMGLFGQKVVADLRREVFAHLAGMSPAQLAMQRSGDLLSRFSADVSAVEIAATYTVGSYVRDGLQIIILVAVALSLSWKLALGTLLILPVAILPASRLTRSVMKRSREGQTQLGNLAAQLQEGLGGLKTIQAFNAQSAELSRFDAQAAAHRRAMIRAGWARGAVPGVMEILASFAIACALAYAAATRSIPPEELISVLTAVVLIYQPAKDLGRVSQFALSAAVSGERIFALLDARHPVQDAPGAKEAAPLASGVRLEDVRFSYGERSALDGLTLDLPVGKVTALVGPSGGGKSTLASLLLRFDKPQGGRILVDGVDVAELTADSVRAQFALVTQEALLFSAPVIDNLRFGKPDASMEEVVQAARIANADEFIRQLPKGYQTPIGERGVVLSGGQKQRLCLARAVLAGAPVLVLDEATSNLDPRSEAEVRDALGRVLKGRTALIIAHRLSTVVDADVIHVLEAGRVVQSGRHQELLHKGGLYTQLWALQEGLGHAKVGVA
jgi:subfamily B ATP-binding cassette protein MsbA